MRTSVAMRYSRSGERSIIVFTLGCRRKSFWKKSHQFPRGVRNVTWRLGAIERLPLRDSSVDIALLSQALHHAEEPATALAEAARIVAPGGRVLVLDLREHDQEWVRSRLGDRWRGFSDARLAQLLKGAGLADVRVTVGARRTGDPFTVLIASGVKRPQGGR